MKRNICGSGILLIGVLTLLSGCGEKSSAPRGEVLARVGESVITTRDLKQEWRKQYFSPEGQPREGVDNLLNDMVVEKLFLEEARRRKIDKDPRFLREVANYREQLLVETLLNKAVLAVGKPTEMEIEEYWKNNQKQFSVPELIRISHILIKPIEGQEDEATEQRGEEIVVRLKGGEDFALIAREISQGAGAGRGGDLGFFRHDQLNPELEQAAWSLATGEIAGPIKTDYGYHIVTVTGRKAPRRKEVSEARPEIIKAIQARNRKNKFDSLQAELKKKSPVAINQEILTSLKADLVQKP